MRQYNYIFFNQTETCSWDCFWQGRDEEMYWSDVLSTSQDSRGPFYFGPLAGYEKDHQKQEEETPDQTEEINVGRNEKQQSFKFQEEIRQAWKKDLGEKEHQHGFSVKHEEMCWKTDCATVFFCFRRSAWSGGCSDMEWVHQNNNFSWGWNTFLTDLVTKSDGVFTISTLCNTVNSSNLFGAQITFGQSLPAEKGWGSQKTWTAKNRTKFKVGHSLGIRETCRQNIKTFSWFGCIFCKLKLFVLFACFRYIWIIAVVVAISFFVSQVAQRMAVYFQYKTNVAVEVKYIDKIKFPAVTICNQNNYRYCFWWSMLSLLLTFCQFLLDDGWAGWNEAEGSPFFQDYSNRTMESLQFYRQSLFRKNTSLVRYAGRAKRCSNYRSNHSETNRKRRKNRNPRCHFLDFQV